MRPMGQSEGQSEARIYSIESSSGSRGTATLEPQDFLGVLSFKNEPSADAVVSMRALSVFFYPLCGVGTESDLSTMLTSFFNSNPVAKEVSWIGDPEETVKRTVDCATCGGRACAVR